MRCSNLHASSMSNIASTVQQLARVRHEQQSYLGPRLPAAAERISLVGSGAFRYRQAGAHLRHSFEHASASQAAMTTMREALLVVDMQNDFCLPGAVLCVKGAMGCLPKVVEAVEAARARGVDVVWVIRHHDPAGVDVELFRAPMFAQGRGSTIPGTPGAELVAPLVAAPSERVVVKKRFSAFFQTELDMVLRRRGVQRVTICGVQTPNCIRGTAWDAIALDYPRIAVLADATASATEAIQEANLADMRAAAVETPTVAEWAARLAGGGGEA